MMKNDKDWFKGLTQTIFLKNYNSNRPFQALKMTNNRGIEKKGLRPDLLFSGLN